MAPKYEAREGVILNEDEKAILDDINKNADTLENLLNSPY